VSGREIEQEPDDEEEEAMALTRDEVLLFLPSTVPPFRDYAWRNQGDLELITLTALYPFIERDAALEILRTFRGSVAKSRDFIEQIKQMRVEHRREVKRERERGRDGDVIPKERLGSS